LPGVTVTEPCSFDDVPAPAGYVFLGDARARLAHLAAADEDRSLSVCGGAAADYEEFTYLPHGIDSCSACLRIADEASSRSD
jgi:hypothetical protein